jgi:propionyl-CoA carboxylase beta chain
MFVTGPDVIKTVTHEEVSKEELGGAHTHAARSGVCHFAYTDEASTLKGVQRLLGYIPSNNLDGPTVLENKDPLNRSTEKISSIIPENSKRPYDIREVIKEVVDSSTFFEVHSEFA